MGIDIATFGASAASSLSYVRQHTKALQQGASIDETPADERRGKPGITQLQQDSVQVNTNASRAQVVVSQALDVNKVDEDFVPETVEQAVQRQTVRQILRHDQKSDLLLVKERVDSYGDDGLLGTWQRNLEIDPSTGAIAIIPAH